jgi:hypothetical protein
MKYIILALIGSIPVSSFADCMGDQRSLGGKFEVLAKTEARMGCIGEGDLKIRGCMLKLRMLEPLTKKVEQISVYGNPEVCGWKEKKIVELYVARECCDVRYGIRCSEGQDGLYPYQMTDSVHACMSKTPFYIYQYRKIEKGKSVIRTYNAERKSFENSKENKMEVPDSDWDGFSGGEILRRSTTIKKK